MIERLYEKLGLPKSCALGQRVYKKLFFENTELTSTDRRALTEDVDRIVWQYALKPDTVPVRTYTDAEREYLEIAIIELRLHEHNRLERLTEMIHRAIPYPVLLVVEHEGAVCLNVAHKRFSRAMHEAIVAEDFHTTSWLEVGALTPAQEAFLDSLSIDGLPHTHFFAMYTAIVERVLALAASEYSGEFRLQPALTEEERREGLARCHEIERELTALRAAIRREVQFARQVELNMKIKKLEQRLASAVARL